METEGSPNDDRSVPNKEPEEIQIGVSTDKPQLVEIEMKRLEEMPPDINEPVPNNAIEEPRNQEDSVEEQSESDAEMEPSETPRRGRGRPKIMRTGSRGRPRKVYQQASMNQEEYAFSAEIPVREAVKSPEVDEWYHAMTEELISIIRNNTWELKRRPPNRDVIGSRFVLRNKYGSNGDIERRKARIVAKGFSQKPGVDFYETFAPVARLSSIRLLTALAAKYRMTIHQIDVTTAYLNGDIEEQIYMEPPELLEEILERVIRAKSVSNRVRDEAATMLAEIKEGDKVCLIKKALYGLRQAARSWNTKISEVIKEYGGSPSEADPCVYRIHRKGAPLLIAIYVDDIVIACEDIKEIEKFKSFLASKFEIQDRGEINYCIGVEFDINDSEITIHQRGYIVDLLNRFGLANSNSVTTPTDTGVKLTRPEGAMDKESAQLPYRELVGALMYLATATRPDIAYAVSCLSQFLTNYRREHWNAAKRILRYLKGTSNIGITYGLGDGSLIGFTDSDWANCMVDRRSYTGYIFLFNGGAITWESRKQRTVALSSTEAEYMALTEAAKEAIYLRRLLLSLSPKESSEIIVHSDNQGVKLLSLLRILCSTVGANTSIRGIILFDKSSPRIC